MWKVKLKLVLNCLIYSLVFLSLQADARELKIKAQKASIDDKNLLLTLEDSVSLELDEITIFTSKAVIKFNNKYEPMKLIVQGKIKIYNKKHHSQILADSAEYDFITKKLNLSGNVHYTTLKPEQIVKKDSK